MRRALHIIIYRMVPKSTIIFGGSSCDMFDVVERRDYLVGLGLATVEHPQAQKVRSYAFHGIE